MASKLRTIGSRIREARLSAGMTQATLAHATRTRERNIVRWENGHNEPRFEHVAAIARATGKEMSFFTDGLGDDEDEEEDHAVMLRAAYHLDRAGEHSLADDLRVVARKTGAGAPERSLSAK